MRITIIGGGRGGHVAAGYFGWTGHTVFVLTRAPEKWNKVINVETKGSRWEEKDIQGPLAHVTSKPEEVIPQSEVIFICLPVNAYRTTLTQIAPHTSPDAWVGTLFAQGGFDWMAAEAFGRETLRDKRINVFGFQTIPWICREPEYGKVGRMGDAKRRVFVACLPTAKRCACADLMTMLLDIQTEPLPNFLNLTLTPSNQIIHTGLMYGRHRDWDGEAVYDHIPTLYEDLSSEEAHVIGQLDMELQYVKHLLLCRYPKLELPLVLPLAERIVKNYGDSVKDKSSLHKTIKTNIGYSQIFEPMSPVLHNPESPATPSNVLGYHPNTNSRLFWDDIPNGLMIIRDIAEMLGLPTPVTDEVIYWHQKHMGCVFLENGKITPEGVEKSACPRHYGITNVDDLIKRYSEEVSADGGLST